MDKTEPRNREQVPWKPKVFTGYTNYAWNV